jgi:hypothetical protein
MSPALGVTFTLLTIRVPILEVVESKLATVAVAVTNKLAMVASPNAIDPALRVVA